jgi:hypothetical protein
MALTKVSYSMITGSPVNVLDYADLVVTRTGPLRGVDPSTGWLGSSYEDWQAAIQAAFDAAENGSVVLPDKGSPYVISDVVILRTNTTFYCDGWIKLGNATTGGGIAGTLDGSSNCTIYGLKIDGSNIYTGGSGENGWGFGGSYHRLNGGHIKNCARGASNGDGGKGIQNETEYGNIIIDGVSFENCFMAMSTRQEHILHAYDCGPQIFSNITAENCNILFFVEYAGVGSAPDGKKHSVVLDGFSARNCGNFEGALQFSNAGNVLVSNGLIINPGFITPAFIRGRHRYCQFNNLQFSGNCTNIINNSPGTYSPLTAGSEQNTYAIQHIGTISTAIGSSVTVDRVIANSFINLTIDTDVSSGLVDSDVDDTSTNCVITFDDKVLRGSTTFIATYCPTFATVGWTGDVIGNCQAGVWTPTITSSSGVITTISNVVGLYRKVGRQVNLFLTFDITNNGTGSGALLLSTSTLPASVTPPVQGTTGTFTENTIGPFFGFAYNPGTGGNPLGLLKYDATYPGVTGGRYSCAIQYSVAN